MASKKYTQNLTGPRELSHQYEVSVNTIIRWSKILNVGSRVGTSKNAMIVFTREEVEKIHKHAMTKAAY